MSRSYQSPRKLRLIIFDFDGVLADTFDTFYPLIRDSMKPVGIKLSRKQYESFFIGNVHGGYKNFIKDGEKLKKFLKNRKMNYDKYYFAPETRAKLFLETDKFLNNLSKKHNLTIASSGYTKNIKKLLGKSKKYFSLILADSNPKEHMINKILKKFGANPGQTIFVTDTTGDIKVAQKMGLKTAAVTWGFHSEKLLKSAEPDHIAKSFKILYKILTAF